MTTVEKYAKINRELHTQGSIKVKIWHSGKLITCTVQRIREVCFGLSYFEFYLIYLKYCHQIHDQACVMRIVMIPDSSADVRIRKYSFAHSKY